MIQIRQERQTIKTRICEEAVERSGSPAPPPP